MKHLKWKYMVAIMLLAGGSAAIIHNMGSRTLHPTSDRDMFKVTVRIMNLEETSGGTGAILKSDRTGSSILTNLHVCEVIKNGGVIDPPSHVRVLIKSYKEDSEHDLCLIRVNANLHVNLEIADEDPVAGDEAVIAGHPALMATVITRGIVSEHMIIQVQDGSRECTKEEKDDPQMGFLCALFGNKIPTVINREAVLVTATIMPGSSGSPVFSDEGKIIAVVFAGQGQLGYAMCVPRASVQDFVERAATQPWIQVH